MAWLETLTILCWKNFVLTSFIHHYNNEIVNTPLLLLFWMVHQHSPFISLHYCIFCEIHTMHTTKMNKKRQQPPCQPTRGANKYQKTKKNSLKINENCTPQRCREFGLTFNTFWFCFEFSVVFFFGFAELISPSIQPLTSNEKKNTGNKNHNDWRKGKKSTQTHTHTQFCINSNWRYTYASIAFFESIENFPH